MRAVPRSAGAPPAAVWLLVGLQLLLAVGWSLLAPIYRAPDEPQHVDLARTLSLGEPYPEVFTRMIGAQVVASARAANLSADGAPEPDRATRFTAENSVPRRARPSFAVLAGQGPSTFGNQMPQHPPLYYRLAAVPLTALPEATSYDVQVWLLRLVNAALVAPLPLLCWLAARRVGAGPDAALAAAALPVAIPQLAHLGGAVNNDVLLALAVGLVTVEVARIVRGDLRLRVGLLAGLWSAAALLTKGFALFLPVWLVVAYAVGWWRAGRDRDATALALASAALALAGSTALGGWWWIRNLLELGTLQPEGAGLQPADSGFAPDLAFWLPHAASRVVLRFWGQFGWVEVPLPWPLVWLCFAVVGGGVAAALLLRRPPVAARRFAMATLLVPLAGIGAIVAYGGWTIYARTGLPAGLQGRYLYPGLVGLAAVAAAGGAALLRRQARWLPPAILSAGGALQAYAAWVVLGYWYGPAEPGDVAAALRGVLAWAPLPPVGLGLIVALGLAVGVAAMTALTWRGFAPRAWRQAAPSVTGATTTTRRA